MLIGVPKETKAEEYRVGLTPESVGELTTRGHGVIVERDAGAGIGASDDDYRSAGATIADGAGAVFARAELIVKVKEPLPPERARLRSGQGLFSYLHLAPDPAQARDLLERGVIAIAYETVTAPGGGLPLLAPMSAVAGRMAVQAAAHYLERPHGARGVLFSGAAGVPPARVLVLGAGMAGTNAIRIALGMGADVTALDRSEATLRRLHIEFGSRLKTLIASPDAIAQELRRADVVIGAALVPGALAPKLVTRSMLAGMQRGTVMVDISIDQGGCFETSRPTTHAHPVYEVDGVIHYCVANMPGAVPRTSTYALNYATIPYISELASRGIVQAMTQNEHLRNGLSICSGAVTRRELADALNYPYTDPLVALGGVKELQTASR
jgi:alanine dehydrogenase